MAMATKKSFFSVSFDFIIIGGVLPYSLYVNSSKKEGREHFVRVFAGGEDFQKEDLDKFKSKFPQMYVDESERSLYMKSLVKSPNVNEVEKTRVIKDSAIKYLDKLFDDEKTFTTEVLVEALDNCREAVESMVDVVQDYNIEKIQELIGSLSFHDFYTYDHSINVSMYCISLFQTYKPDASRDEIVMAGLGGLLHDLGKIKIPTEILNSPHKLTDEEFKMIKNHPDFGKEMLCENCAEIEASMGEAIDWDSVSRVVHEHHENYNGTGYPAKKHAEDIHVMARMTAIADFFDAITTKRSYHEVLSAEEALAVMSRSVGKKLDPFFFKLFAENIKKPVRSGMCMLQAPDDFDPCMPHQELPFAEVKKEEKKADFGKIKIQEKPVKKKKVA